MRKISLILAVLLFAVPAWAGEVLLSYREVPWDGNTIIVSYEVVGEPNLVRAFALDITVDQGAVITDINDTVSDYYTIYPGSVVISGGDITDEGQAVADYNDYPADTKLGLDTNGVTVEMGALYYPTSDSSPNAPPTSGDLLNVTVGGVKPGVKLSFAQNTARGGVVLTNPDEPFDFNAPDYTFATCMIGGGGNGNPTENLEWHQNSRPPCWCYCRQCRGDINGMKTGPYWVQSLDLALFRRAFNKRGDQWPYNGICADLDHDQIGPYRVQAVDLALFRTYFNKRGTHPNAPLLCDQIHPTNPYVKWQTAIYVGPFNFWCGPTGCHIDCPTGN